MAQTQSFDVTSGVDLQEVDNAINQANKEIGQRYDFKGQKTQLDYDRKAGTLTLAASDEFYLNAMWQVIRERMVSRKVPVKNLERGKVEPASGGTVRQVVKLKQGISQDQAKPLIKQIKDKGFKVQAQIQGDAIRVTGKDKDELQKVITFVKALDLPMPVLFENYR